jgi:uncharacterized protein (TIGR00255 family)
MTGFGRASGVLSDRFSASVVVRSVNHRYLDVQVRTSLREELPELEAMVKSVVSKPLERGRVSVQVDLERIKSYGTKVVVDGDAVASVLDQLQRIDLPERVARPVELGDVLTIPGLVSVSGEVTLLDEDETRVLTEISSEARDRFVAMRREEGERLREQLVEELERLTEFVAWFEPEIPAHRQRILERLRERLERLLGPEVVADEQRIAQEAAILADRGDVSEEIVRLRAHLDSFRSRLEEGGTVGRTLDFLCQEIHRELNTLGSKCREADVTERLVEAKTATERLREQVQNLE